MARVMDTATISTRDRRDHDDSTVEGRAYLVWRQAHRQIDKTVRKDDGFTYKGNLTSVILSLWPELSPSSMKEELERFRSEVYAYLKQTSNAYCTKRGTNGAQVEWFLSAQWNTPTEAVVLRIPVRAPLQPTHTEKKLTPKEAGEDRTPAPVTVSYIEPKDDEVTASAVENRAEFAEQKAQQHADVLELVKIALESAGDQPLTLGELAAATGYHTTTVRTATKELEQSGEVSRREETSAERSVRFAGKKVGHSYALLHALGSTVPTRTKQNVVAGYSPSATTPTARGVSQDAMLRAMSTTKWMRPAEIVRRAGVPTGSSTMILKRLLQDGLIEQRKSRKGNGHVTQYRRLANSPAPIVSTPQSAPAPSPVKAAAPTNARSEAIAAVDRLIAEYSSADVALENARLKTQLADAQKRIVELETALAPLQALLGRKG